MRNIHSFADIDAIIRELDELTGRVDEMRGDLEDYSDVYDTICLCSTPCDDGNDGTFNIVSKEQLKSLYERAQNELKAQKELLDLAGMTAADLDGIDNAIDRLYDYAKVVNFALITVATHTNVGELLLHKAEMTYDAILRDLESTIEKLSNDEKEN